MTKECERVRVRKLHATSLRHDDESLEQMNLILSENPLYSPSHILRAAMQVLYRLSSAEREAEIIAAAKRQYQ